MSEVTTSAIFLTLKIASFATIGVFVPGIALGYFLARNHSNTARLVSTLALLPMVVPPSAIGYLLLRMMATNGPFGKTIQKFDLHMLLTWQAATVASAVMALPLVVRTARIAFEGVDPRLEMMKRTLGFGPLQTFLRTTLPLAYRGLLAAAIIGFTRAVGEFGATIVVAGNIPFRTQTLSTAIFSAEQAGQHNEAMFLIGIALALGFAAILATEILCRRTQTETVV